MELSEFKSRVQVILEEMQVLSKTICNPNNKRIFDEFSDAFGVFKKFVDDDQNIEVLKRYMDKKEDDKDHCPLDILCKTERK